MTHPDGDATSRLRQKLSAVTEQTAGAIEQRILQDLIDRGRFEDTLSSDELAQILRSIVYALFEQYRFGGVSVGLLHNISTMDVRIDNHSANIYCIVHIHKPIIAFLTFRYTLINDPVSVTKKLRLKRGTLKVTEHTRRFDLKAKAALTAVNLQSIAQNELTDLGKIIRDTLPPQLAKHGAKGSLNNVELALNGEHLEILLEGDFARLDIK